MNLIKDRWNVEIDTRADLGEGSFWDSEHRLLYWVDINRAEVHRYDPATGADRHVTMPSKCGTVVARSSGGFVAALEDRIVAADPDWAEGSDEIDIATIVTLEDDIPANRANDGKCDPAGRLWVGTMGPGRSLRGADGTMPDGAALYRIDCDGSVHTMVSGIAIGNGICWSADLSTMYYIDTKTRRVDRFDYDHARGEVANRRAHTEVPNDYGAPDGMAIDEEGNLWVAMWGGRRVTRWHGATGELIDAYEIPATKVTSCAFGGDDLATLFVTTAAGGLSHDQLQNEPHAGALFSLDVGVRGVAMTPFCG